jgi:colicin import membrane protein
VTRIDASRDAPAATAAQPGRIRAVFLAILVHGAFFALIVFGVRWQTAPTAPLQAELWAKLPPVAAKAPEPVKPAPEPEPPKAEPPKPAPPKAEPVEEAKPEPVKPDPEIARRVEREKREKEKREKLEKERLEKQKQEEARKKREREEEAKKKREDEKRRKEEEIAKREAQKEREAAQAARVSEINGYVDRIRSKIRGRANVPDTVTGAPEVTLRLHILPGGEVLDIQITKRSGNPTYDAAIERAVRSAQPLPVPPANSELFPSFRDLTLNIKHDR